MERVKTKPEEKESKYYFSHPFNNEEVVIELTVKKQSGLFEIDPIYPERIKYEGVFDFTRGASDAGLNNIVCMLIEDATNFAVKKLKEAQL